MSGEDQERFEDYLELERFIAELQTGHATYPPPALTPAQARVYRMAMLFHEATQGVSEPDPKFATRLQARLREEAHTPPEGGAPVETRVSESLSSPSKPGGSVPRRWLLAGSVSAAASIALTAGATHIVDIATRSQPSSGNVPAITPTPGQSHEVTVRVASPLEWFLITTVTEMDDRAVRFRVEDQNGSLSLTGYLLRSAEASPDTGDSEITSIKRGDIIAMSAACTHRGCIVEWSGSDRKFHCPCHGGVFDGTGGIDQEASSITYLTRLPLLDVDVRESGEIYVRMPSV